MSDEGIGDRELLEQFTHSGSHSVSHDAFAEIVRRYVDLVYTTCFRDLHDHHLAEDATQAVFLVLSRKARSLRREVVLAGWLYQTARLVVRNARKQEARRRNREQRAAEMSRQTSTGTLTWDSLSPLVGDGLDKLPGKDREAILLHYYQRKSHAEVGAALGVSEDAARMRVARAVDKLRDFLKRKGHTMALAAVTTLLMANAVQAAPPTCAATIVAAVCPLAGKAALASASASALANAAMKSMLLAKAKAVAAVVAATLLVPTIGLATYQALARQNDHEARGPVAVAETARAESVPTASTVAEPRVAQPASGSTEPIRERTPRQLSQLKNRAANDVIRFHVENGLLCVIAPTVMPDGKPVPCDNRPLRMSVRGILGEVTIERSPTSVKIENKRVNAEGAYVQTRIIYQPGVSMLVQRTIKARSGKEYASIFRQSHGNDPSQTMPAAQITLQVTADGGENWVSWTAEDYRHFIDSYPLAYLAHLAPLFRDFTSRNLCFLPINAARQVLTDHGPATTRPLSEALSGGDLGRAVIWRREIEMLNRDNAFLIDCLECDELDIRKAALKRLSERLGKPIAFDVNDPPDKRRTAAAALRRTLAGGKNSL